VNSVPIRFEILERRIDRFENAIPDVNARAVQEMVTVGFNNYLHTRRRSTGGKLAQSRLTTRMHVGLRIFDHDKPARTGEQKAKDYR
jgi:hypothetical protein